MKPVFIPIYLLICTLFSCNNVKQEKQSRVLSANNSFYGNAALIQGCQWRQVRGASQSVILNPNKPTTEVTGLIAGVYEYEFSVWNEYGVGRDCCIITVNYPTLLLRLLSFKASSKRFYNVIEWQAEEGNDRFELLRNGQPIYYAQKSRMNFKDYSFEPISRYQLKQTDDQGKTAYSEVITIANRPEKEDIIVSGSMVNYISRFRTQAILSVYTTAGALVAQREFVAEVGNNRTDLKIKTSGVLIYSVITPNSRITKKIISNGM